MIKAVIFDCFGVILGDANALFVDKLHAANPDVAKEIHSIQRAGDMGILSAEEVTDAMSEKLGLSVQEILATQQTGEVRNEQLLSYIRNLKEKYPVAMLSNISGRDRLEIRFEAGQLDSHFHEVVASGEVGHAKPEPAIYHHVAAKLGVEPSECIMIDDIAAFCDGARAVGMQAIQFIDTQQTIDELEAALTGV